MLNFASSTPTQNDGAPRGQYQQPNIPVGTKLLCNFKLHDVPFCFNPATGFIAADQTSGLLKFFFELKVVAPAQYAGCKLGGSKYVTESIQRKMNIEGDYSQCAKGDKAVHAILACDAMVKGRTPEYEISSYRNLDGLMCACEVGSFKDKLCIRVFLDPTNTRDRGEISRLIEQMNQADPAQMPDVPAHWDAPAELDIF